MPAHALKEPAIPNKYVIRIMETLLDNYQMEECSGLMKLLKSYHDTPEKWRLPIVRRLAKLLDPSRAR